MGRGQKPATQKTALLANVGFYFALVALTVLCCLSGFTSVSLSWYRRDWADRLQDRTFALKPSLVLLNADKNHTRTGGGGQGMSELLLPCCVTSKETVRTSTSSFTQLLSSVWELGWCCFMSTETVGLLGTGTQDVHLDFHTAPESMRVQIHLTFFTQWWWSVA